jgi:hypothetical protein
VLTAAKDGTLQHGVACVSSRVLAFAYYLISDAWTLMYRIQTFKL